MSGLILRLLPYAAVAFALIGGFLWYGSSRYDAGERAAWAEAQASIDKANAANAAKDAKYRTDTAELRGQLVDALNRPAIIRTVVEPRTLVKEVIREGDTCLDFDSSFRLQWNAIVTGDSGAPAAPAVPAAPGPEGMSAARVVRRSDF